MRTNPTHTIPSLSGTFGIPARLAHNPKMPKEPSSPSRSNTETERCNKMIINTLMNKGQLVTSCIVHLADSANIKGVTPNKRCSGLTGLCFESPNDTIHVTVSGKRCVNCKIINKNRTMNCKVLIILILFIVPISLTAQIEYITEDENNIYWQPDAKIDFSDYQSPTNDDCIKYNEKHGLQMSSSIGFRGIVDIPKKKRKFDKFYIAPVFCKNCSCILSEDSLSLQVDRLLFDVAEVFARGARRELFDLQKEMNADNTYTMFFTTVKNDWDEKMRGTFKTIIREVLIEKIDTAYVSWRQLTDELLLETESYATKNEDCYRFVLNEPIEKGYKQAKTIMGDMRNNKKEEE